jgi:hypothetical protein
MLQPGQRLYFDPPGEVSAILLASGALQLDSLTGSIHKLGRMLKNGPCNGWEHWYYQDESGELLPLDTLREQYLAQVAAEPTHDDK